MSELTKQVSKGLTKWLKRMLQPSHPPKNSLKSGKKALPGKISVKSHKRKSPKPLMTGSNNVALV